MMTVRELIKELQKVEGKDVNVFAAVGDACLMVHSVQSYDDAVELWTLSAIRRDVKE
jgi:hypothetical protein